MDFDSEDTDKLTLLKRQNNWCTCNLRRHKQKQSRNSRCRKKIERVVYKSGEFNFEKNSLTKYHVFPDIVTAFIAARWRWTLIYCFMTYMTTWLLFTAVWWVILYIHGDLEPEHLPDVTNSTWTPCVREIYSFTSIFLFSIEIHTTIGYGTRSLTLECAEAMVTMGVESILGTIVQSFIVGIVFAKLTRPKNRAHTLLFSKNAVINQKDRKLCLMFRVGNTRKSRVIAIKIKAYLIRCGLRVGNLYNEQIQLDLTADSSENIFFMFPMLAVHIIDDTSPFYSISAEELLKSDIEILVVFEGTIESTGQPLQIRSSYTSAEILWGHRFSQLIDYKDEKLGFVLDYSKFDETSIVNTPLCSAKSLFLFYTNYLYKNQNKKYEDLQDMR